MKHYICSICGYIYDEEEHGRWDDLPDDWKCPICGAGKDAFQLHEKSTESDRSTESGKNSSKPEFKTDLSPMELSIICSNLARGCEKQYQMEQMKDFQKLADFFRSQVEPEPQASTEEILALIENALAEAYPYANTTANEQLDRGALRALLWSQKVSRMIQSLLNRYHKDGDKMLENSNVFVCSVCGFITVGNAPPELCPVCKVPAWKFERVERRSNK